MIVRQQPCVRQGGHGLDRVARLGRPGQRERNQGEGDYGDLHHLRWRPALAALAWAGAGRPGCDPGGPDPDPVLILVSDLDHQIIRPCRPDPLDIPVKLGALLGPARQWEARMHVLCTHSILRTHVRTTERISVVHR